MEKKSEDILKKVTNLIEESKRKKITDFDSGLLQESFEPVIGTTEEKYDLWCKRLLNVATRLENIRVKNKGDLDDENYFVLKEIDAILKEDPPQIKIVRGDGDNMIIMTSYNVKGVSTCRPDTFETTLKLVKEREYQKVVNHMKLLEYKAKARLDSVKWHRDDTILTVDSAKEVKA